MKGLLIFAAGLAVGAVAGAVIVKNKVLADAKAEIEEVREYYRESRGQKDEHVEEVKEVKEVEKKEYELKDIQIKDEPKTEKEHTNYSQITKMYMSNDKYNQSMYDDPFVIDPSEFGENPEYDTETLTYFADGVLVDDVDDVIEDPDIVVGLENLKVFEEFVATTVYVRNEIYITDY